MKKIVLQSLLSINYLRKVKLLVSVAVFSLSSFIASSQVVNYTMTNATASYASQSGLTNLATGTGTGGTMDNAIFTGIPIGFHFVFNCQTYDSIGVSTNGFIWFGHTNPSTTEFTPISSATAMDGVISAFALDLIGGGGAGGQGSPRLSYGNPSIGVFMVEWNGCKRAGGSATGQTNRWDMQIKLYQTTNVVQIRINDYQYGYLSANTGQIGLRGATNADFKNIGVTCSGNSWGAPTTTGNANTATASMYPCYPGGSSGVCQQFTYTPLHVTANSTANPICTGSSITLTGGGATTYTWDNGVTNGVAFVPSGTTTYHVTGSTAGACTDTTAITITVNPIPTVGAVASSPTVCSGGMETLTGTGASTYVWDNGVTNGVPFPVTSTTTYNVTGTIGGCSNTASVTVTVGSSIAVTANTTAASVCSGASVTLTGGGATSYTWDNGVTDGVAFTPASTATYIVTGTSGTCSATASVTVTVGSTISVTANTTAAAVCAGDNVTLTGGGASSYTWDNGVTDGVAFVPASTGTYIVTGTSSGCSNTASVTVTVNPVPAVTANTSAASICAGDNVTLTGGGASSYTWDNGVTDGAAFATSSTATYNVTGTSSGCSGSASVTVTVNSAPITPSAITGSTSVCAGTSVYSVVPDANATSYSWTLPANWTGTSSVDTIAATVSTNGGTVSVIANNACGSSSAQTLIVGFGNAPAQPSSIVGVTNICEGSSTAYGVTNDINATSYTWTLPATWSGNSTTSTITATADTSSGVITVTANNSCGSSTPQSVNVFGSVMPVVTVSSFGTVCESGGSITLSGGAPAGGNYSGIGVNSNTFDPIVSGAGTFYISYTYVNGACTVADSATITVDLCIGISTNSFNQGFNIYPNPFSSETMISFDKEQKNTLVKITDVVGKEIRTYNFSGKQLVIEKGAMKEGIYFIQLVDENKNKTTEKIVVQ